MSLSAVILAAGRSTRMKSRRPKPLAEVCGLPMLDYILRACYDAGCSKVVVVIGHGKDEVLAQFGDDKRIIWVEQTEQLGTGHAVKVCSEQLSELGGDMFILAGDGPLIRAQVLKTLLQAHTDEHASATMATAILEDPTGFGRITRDAQGRFLDIVEQIDCTPEQLNIREVFPSYYCVHTGDLLWALGKLTNENRKKEFYLTDIFGHLRRAGKSIAAVQAVAAEDVLSVNTRQQQAEVDAIMQDRIQRTHRDAGVSIVSPHTTYVEAGTKIGVDTVLHPFSFVGRESEIGSDCVVGPFAMIPRNSLVPDGATVRSNVSETGGNA